MTTNLDVAPILQTAFAFWSSKVLLTAVEFGVFTKLASGGSPARNSVPNSACIRAASATSSTRWSHEVPRPRGDGPDAQYFNTPAGALFLDRNSPRYVGGILEMLNARLFRFWHDLPEALRTGKPQNEIKHGRRGCSRSSTPTCRGSSSSWAR